ncbi:MAG: hypothetical protein V3U07_05165, partial [Nitrospirales bacterium]
MDHSPPDRLSSSDNNTPYEPSLLSHPNPSPSNPSEDNPLSPAITPISKEKILQKPILDKSEQEQINWSSETPPSEIRNREYFFHEESLPPPSTFSTWGLPILLFGLTVFTTLWAGAFQVNTRPVKGAWDFLIHHPTSLVNGIPFAATLLGILVTHELGHYVLSRIHRVPASFPLFIPGPPHLIGTFG